MSYVQGQSEKQRQKLEAEFHRSQQQTMNRATLEQQQQQQQQAAHQQQQVQYLNLLLTVNGLSISSFFNLSG